MSVCYYGITKTEYNKELRQRIGIVEYIGQHYWGSYRDERIAYEKALTTARRKVAKRWAQRELPTYVRYEDSVRVCAFSGTSAYWCDHDDKTLNWLTSTGYVV